MSLNMKNINEFTQPKIWISGCDVHTRDHELKASLVVWAQCTECIRHFQALCVCSHVPIREQGFNRSV